MHRRNVITLIAIFSIGMFASVRCLAGIETNEKFMNGPFANGANFTTQDKRFNDAAWNTYVTKSNLSTITLRVMDKVLISAAFSYTANLQIQYYTSPTATVTTVNKTLTVNYAPGQGIKYKGMDVYTFTGAYKIIVTVTSTSSTGTPPVLSVQLSTNIVIDRSYPFTATTPIAAVFTKLNNHKQLQVKWNMIKSADEYDVEWTTINNGNSNFALIISDTLAASNPGIPALNTALAQSFRNNASRATTTDSVVTLSMLSTDSVLLVRIRQAQYDRTSGVRVAGNWDYTNGSLYAIWTLKWDEQNQNWQYSAAYAEGGKKKEVISYFDGTLRGRQTVTLSNSDNVAIGQENIYDDFGRPTASILPAPYKEPSLVPYLHYITLLNQNAAGQPYTSANVSGTTSAACELNPDPLNTAAGASRYYSSLNDFRALNLSNNYIPDAAGYPLSATQYTNDNTGRIKSQGGVGLAFQPGKSGSPLLSKTTKYYYGKPEQWELDQLFANDVGYAEHFLKNMVVDPNGQISVSYLNASGKTVATALTGKYPANLDSLPSYKPTLANTKPQNIHILKPEQFVYNTSSLALEANTTYTASVVGTDTLKFNIQKLIDSYPNAFQICSNCFYKMTVKVSDDCGNAVASISTPVRIGDTVANCSGAGSYQGSLTVPVLQVGEYNVNIKFAFDNNIIQRYADTYIKKGLDSGYLEQQFNYIKKRYLDSIDVSGCYSDCHTCSAVLGAQSDFVQMLQGKCIALGLDSASVMGTSFSTWANGLYTTLKAQCTAAQASCTYSPCTDVQQVMLADVSPGGQYALFDANRNPLESTTNVLSQTKPGAGHQNWRVVFPVKLPTDSVYKSNQFMLPDSTVTSPNDTTFTLQKLVAYWQPAWAVKFLNYHPEICKLQFCMNNATYEAWDMRVQQDINKASDVPLIPTGGAPLSYAWDNPANWLLAGDPFFKTGAPGAAYYTQMNSDLATFAGRSGRVLPIVKASNKSIMQYDDYILYCADKTGNTNTGLPIDSNWTRCTPVLSCRVADREWQLYRENYFLAKKKYYDLLQNAACGTKCAVGAPTSATALPGACPSYTEFSVHLYQGAPTCSGSQTAVLVHDPGTLSQQVTVMLYYAAPYDTTSSRPLSVVLSAGQSQVTFCLPNNIPVSAVHPNVAYCPSPPAYGNDPSFVVAVTDLPGGTLHNDCANATFTVYTTTITLKDSHGNPVPALNPVNVNINYLYTTCANPTTPQNLPITIIIPAGQSSATTQYVENLSCDKPCHWGTKTINISCVNSLFGASNITGLSTCTGYTVNNPQPPPPDTCAAAYATKTSRFPSVTGAPGSSATDTTTLVVQGNAAIKAQAADICNANAAGWISRLQPGLTAMGATPTQVTNLTNAFIAICSNSGDQTHPMGASSLPPGQTLPYPSFGAAIKSILALSAGHYTNLLNPYLIDAPYPYSPIQQSVTKNISNSNAQLCTLLQADSARALTAGKTLYNYLVSTYGSAMTLSAADLKVLQNSCYNCRFIMAGDVTLPVFYDPGSTGCIPRATYLTAKDTMNARFGGTLSTSDPNYQTILSNFMNQYFGFSLTYDDYSAFEAGSATQICNTLPYSSANADPYDCVKNSVSQAVNNGLADYNAYIANQRQLFIASYINTCKLAQANANLVGLQQEYHYTLYYYDQADNLVRTIPPEGVTLVDTSRFSFIDRARDNDTLAVAYNGPATASNLTTALTTLSSTLTAATGSVELWMYNSTGRNYHMVEVTPDKQYLFQAGISGNTLQVDVFPATQPGSTSFQFLAATGHYHCDISAFQPLDPFVCIVFQGNTLGTGASLPQIYLNGVQLTVSTSVASDPLSFTVTAGASSVTFPDSIQTLKHMRLYTHLLTVANIKADAANTFFNASDVGYAGWYRFNVPNPGDPTTIDATTTNETRLYKTYPSHVIPTTYAYNSTNQVNLQNSPDGGTNRLWYDLLSRLVVSQNDKQATGNYSYTLYDALGRITEVGQKNQTTVSLGSPDYLATTTISSFNAAGSNSQVTDTYYDKPVPTVAGNTNGIATLPGQSNLRKRVAASTYTETQGGPALRATYYNYDIDGNVKTLWQQVDGLYVNSTNTGLKRIDYEYDLVSGKVNFVRYQDAQPDAFYYNYGYDADNRITSAWSSTNAVVDTLIGSALPNRLRKLDARYYYYLHGPVRRLELGRDSAQVQGIDYAYTLQGWLKGVNSQILQTSRDIGRDSLQIAKDAYGYSLGYFNGDYTPIGGAATYKAFALSYTQNTGDITGQSLYNGNIGNSTLAVSQLGSGAMIGYTYRYDQLNRLKKMRQYTGINSSWSRSNISLNYQENATYDGNGNILTYGRNGAAPTAQTIDSLTYNYNLSGGRLVNNRLNYITDAIANSLYTGDLTNQTNTTNYRYDAIGNLIYDAQSNITGNDGVNAITWSVYGKILSIYKTTGTISYTYNPAGERVSKTAAGLTTYYIRDAQGNTLAVYDNKSSAVNWREQHLYGSNRLGIWTPNVNLVSNNALAVWDTTGGKQFELTNHLGNVISTITEKRLLHSTNGTSIDYYLADVVTAQDYYPFGMLIPGRQYSFINNATYRYGFNGKENDNEVKGVGEQQDYGMRIYDPRVGRFLSVDPISKQYPWYTPYQFAGNKPIAFVDRDGEEEDYIYDRMERGLVYDATNNKMVKMSPKLIREVQVARAKGALIGTALVFTGYLGGVWVAASGESWSSVLAAAFGDPVAAYGTTGAVAGYAATRFVVEKDFQIENSPLTTEIVTYEERGASLVKKQGKITAEYNYLVNKYRDAIDGNTSAAAEIRVAKQLRSEGHDVYMLDADKINKTVGGKSPDLIVDQNTKTEVKRLSGLGGNFNSDVFKASEQAGEGGRIIIVRPDNATSTIEQYREFLKTTRTAYKVTIDVINESSLPSLIDKK